MVLSTAGARVLMMWGVITREDVEEEAVDGEDVEGVYQRKELVGGGC